MTTRHNVIYGCFPCFLSLYFVNLAIKKYNVTFDTIIISTRPVYIHKKKIEGIGGLMWFIRNYGFRYFVYQILLSSSFPFNLFGAKIESFKKLAKKHGINLIYSSNFHSKKIENQLEDRDKNIFVSFGLDQILKKSFISKFKYAVNIHPSELPNFRGPDPIFYFLLSGQKTMGTTLHILNEKIDEGNLLLSERYTKEESDTHLFLLKKSIINGCKLIANFLDNHDTIVSQEQTGMKISYPYKSIPPKEDLSEFQKQHRYVKLSDVSKL